MVLNLPNALTLFRIFLVPPPVVVIALAIGSMLDYFRHFVRSVDLSAET